jgi:hypothetical protein
MTHDAAEDRTLQDDRVELNVEPGDDSPLVEGEGAPLADDAAPHEERSSVGASGVFIGGMPIGVDLDRH